MMESVEHMVRLGQSSEDNDSNMSSNKSKHANEYGSKIFAVSQSLPLPTTTITPKSTTPNNFLCTLKSLHHRNLITKRAILKIMLFLSLVWCIKKGLLTRGLSILR